jgi:hypothetical protein
MGKDSRSSDLTGVANTAKQQYNTLYGDQTGLEKEMIPQSQDMWNTYKNSLGQQTQDYSNIMGGYQNFAANLGSPTKFSAQQVSVNRPGELNEGYGYLRNAAPGYQNFADTGGYSDTDIQELRARGTAPIRSAYSNSMMEMNRARALGGSAGSPNYIAALSRMQRELPEQLSTATTGVNAALADAIRQGKLSGLSGLSNIGSTMGGLASQEMGLGVQAGIANQGADLQAQGMTEQSLQNNRNSQLAALGGQVGLYGTTPAMASTFGNQALNAYTQRINLENMRNQFGLGLLDTQIRGYGGQSPQDPAWKQALNAAGSIAPYLGGGGNNNSNIGPSGNGYTGGFEYPNGGNVYNSNGWDSAGNWQDPWGGWGGGDTNSWENYWNNPNEGMVTGSGLS